MQQPTIPPLMDDKAVQEENWDLDLKSPHKTVGFNELGSDDECERNLNTDCETFGLDENDIC